MGAKLRSEKADAGTATLPVNEYFHKHDEQILGEMTGNGTMRSGEPELTVEDIGLDLSKAVPEALARISIDRDAFQANQGVDIAEAQELADRIALPEGMERMGQGDLVLHLGGLWNRQGDNLIAIRKDIGESVRNRVKAWLPVRDAVKDLKRLQTDVAASNALVEAARERLNTVYDRFVKKHGAMSSPYNRSTFKEDWSAAEVWALEEDYNKETKKAKKADIFRERTQFPYRPPTEAKSAKDALVIRYAGPGRH